MSTEKIVYRMMMILGEVLEPVGIGTNLGLLQVPWTLVSGGLVQSVAPSFRPWTAGD